MAEPPPPADPLLRAGRPESAWSPRCRSFPWEITPQAQLPRAGSEGGRSTKFKRGYPSFGPSAHLGEGSI